MKLSNLEKRKRIKKRIKKSVIPTESKPRLVVFRSNKEIYAQIIDLKGEVLAFVSTRDKSLELKGNKTEKSKEVGKLIAKKAKEKGIETICFDRSGYPYHGRVKSLADGARLEGLKF